MPFTIRKCWRPTNDATAKMRLFNINYEVGTRSVVFSIGTLFLLGLANRNRKYNGTRSVPTTLGFLPRVFPPRLRSGPAYTNLLPLWCFQSSRHTPCAVLGNCPILTHSRDDLFQIQRHTECAYYFSFPAQGIPTSTSVVPRQFKLANPLVFPK